MGKFDRESYRRAIESMLKLFPAHKREEMLLNIIVDEAELRFNAEIKPVTEPLPRQSFTNYDEFNPFLEQDRHEVQMGLRRRGSTEDPDMGPYCTACGHYHYGMC